MPQTIPTSQFLRCGAAALLAATLATGCAHQAAVTAWQPAQVELTGIQRLALRGFDGEAGNAVATALQVRLWNNEFCSLVDRQSAGGVRPAAADDDPAALSAEELTAARNAGINGILVGDVLEYRCDVQPPPGHDPTPIWLPKFVPPAMPDGGAKREATVIVAVQLIDTESGRICLSKQISHSTTHIVGENQTDTPSADEILAQLTDRCVDDVVALLIPHRSSEVVRLAAPAPFQPGYSLVHNGNELAIRGRWDEAISTWRQALTVNPDNDAALFNLSIAHANRQEFVRAESYAIQALNVRQKDAYAAGLQRVRDQSAAYDQTLEQRRDLTAMAGHIGAGK